MTVCGKETIVETTPGTPSVLSYTGDGTKTVEEVISEAYKSWFTLDHSASSPLCGIEKFEIVEKQPDGQFIPLEKVKGYAIASKAPWVDSAIEIDLRQD